MARGNDDSAKLLLLGTLDNESLHRIMQAATLAGHQVRAATPAQLRVGGTGPSLRIWKQGEPIGRPDAVIHRHIKVSDCCHALLSAWERQGVVVLNPPAATAACGNKWYHQELFAQAGIPHPPTELVRNPGHLYEYAREHGYPFVVKPFDGTRSRGVNPVTGRGDIRTRIEPMMDGETGWLAQQFVVHAGAGPLTRDRKAVVVDGEIVTVMQRTGALGEIAASRFGDEDEVALDDLTPQERKYLPAAAAALGLAWCSVDYWLTEDHPAGILINEVNDFPGLPPREAEPFAQAVLALVEQRLAMR
jgi:glutathione synthase/RimK-type ligase-like ATP-grasp enzyme